MRILILSYFYAPEPIPKPHELAVGLAQRGHEVSVITSIPSYPNGEFYPGYRLRPWKKETLDGIPITRLPLMPDHSASGIRRMLSYTSFMVSASLLGPFTARQADVMYVWHPPLTIGVSAWAIGLMRRIPFVYDVRDLWPEAIAATGMMSNSLLLKGLGAMERLVYRRAAAIGVISPGYKQNLISKGVSSEKISVFSDWADGKIYRPVPSDTALAQSTGMSGRFNVLFGGNMGAAQALGTVIETAQRLTQYQKIQFVFVGDGIERPKLEAEVSEKGLNNVIFLGRKTVDQMPQLYALSDVLLAHYKKDPLFEICVPGKIAAYLACQKPILMASEGDSANLIKATNSGVTCPAEDPAAMTKAILKLYHMSPEQRSKMGQSGRQAFLGQYSQDVLIQRHEELLMQVAQSKNRGSLNAGSEGQL